MHRRKVLIYLRPETHASERFADARIEAHHRGDRGELSRTALLAGIALGEIDRRLPSMLATLLADNTSPDTLRMMLASFLNILEGSGPAVAVTATEPPPAVMEQSSSSVSARNLADSLPE
ncbi:MULTISPECIES: plasmid partitioning/stability family protein [Lelliottia]|uniref:Plasmid stabilization protein n=1 Tax=Lelliottia aquatilis TaxID=2080838 RepID=A0ABX5A7N0_9ENTR|nr:MULTISPECIES: plasmid partitioning/stability family protein [Lelliottia]POZ20649.1 plasmid stabilization protein [Lelliottia aquatilis]POZ26015.1 plasmid stabilization protein [Lelliottia aquatilis]POZ29172.1 plasmid stabilization protein [Lelliottia sp. 7254-16]POZ33477.1 plasmid stabilization protein [Lelliottia aquatilis]POZ39798.1 plasmid stabilization protein [Lelliottia aquatilis]